MQHFSVVGYPAHQSKSPLIHQLFAEQTGIALSYTTLEIDAADFAATVLNFTGQGLNVTKPFKHQAFGLADELSLRALRAQAINTIKYHPSGYRYGDNTDGAGLIKDLTKNKQLTLTGKNILVLGAGGAARGIIEPLLNQKPAMLIISNRTYVKAADLAQWFSQYAPVTASTLESVSDYTVDFVINASNLTIMPTISFTEHCCCYDVAYGPGVGPLMPWALRHGLRYWDGVGMLVEQAAEAFFLWHNIYPETKPVLNNPRLLELSGF
jgi:shikimate dehydrogenase